MPVLRVVAEGDVPVVEIVGDVDMTNAAEIGSDLEALVPNAATGLVVDLAQTNYLDSRGVHLILKLAGRLGEHGQALALAVPARSHVRRVLVLTHIDEHVGLFTDVAQAVAQIRSRSAN